MSDCNHNDITWSGSFDYDTAGNPYTTGKCLDCNTEVKEVYTTSTIIEK